MGFGFYVQIYRNIKSNIRSKNLEAGPYETGVPHKNACASQERGCEFYPSAHMKSWVWWCEFIVLVLEGGNGWIAWAC